VFERVAEFGFEEINPGTLYRTLRQMEREGLCKSEWETSTGSSPRRAYSIIDVGEKYRAAWAEGYKRYRIVIDSLFQGYAIRRPCYPENSS